MYLTFSAQQTGKVNLIYRAEFPISRFIDNQLAWIFWITQYSLERKSFYVEICMLIHSYDTCQYFLSQWSPLNQN